MADTSAAPPVDDTDSGDDVEVVPLPLQSQAQQTAGGSKKAAERWLIQNGKLFPPTFAPTSSKKSPRVPLRKAGVETFSPDPELLAAKRRRIAEREAKVRVAGAGGGGRG